MYRESLKNSERVTLVQRILQPILSFAAESESEFSVFGIGSYFPTETFGDVDLILVYSEMHPLEDVSFHAENIRQRLQKIGLSPHVLAVRFSDFAEYPMMFTEFVWLGGKKSDRSNAT